VSLFDTPGHGNEIGKIATQAGVISRHDVIDQRRQRLAIPSGTGSLKRCRVADLFEDGSRIEAALATRVAKRAPATATEVEAMMKEHPGGTGVNDSKFSKRGRHRVHALLLSTFHAGTTVLCFQ
jgi:hypothetical protein